MSKGRPRNYEVEARIITLLSEGMPVGRIASEVGVHRNTIANTRKRIQFRQGTDAVKEMVSHTQKLEWLRLQQEELERQRREAEKNAMLARYRLAIEQLVKFIENAADAVEKCRSVWAKVSLDKPFSNDGSWHHILGATNDPSAIVEAEELSELLRVAMEKLTEFQRKVVSLGVGGEKSSGEIAEMLGADEGDVLKAHSRAIVALREAMGQDAG